MRFSHTHTLLSTFLAFPALLSAVTIDCSHIRIDGIGFDISELSGPHSVHQLVRTPIAIRNTTFTIDICKPLGRSKDKAKAEECPNNSRVCALERYYREGMTEEPLPDDVWPMAGEFIHDGRSMEPSFTRLKDSDSHADAEKEGFRIEMNGGIHDDVKQKVLVELVCDRSRTGLEGDVASEERMRMRDALQAMQEDGDEDDAEPQKPQMPLPNPDEGKSLQLRSYHLELSGGGKDAEEMGVLRLEWLTKYACEDQKDKPDDPADGHKGNGGWGFFTWFIIILFLVLAAYLIFGSWLNYSRYGARGWDLLPHGDTIRDMPYLLKDWGRRVVSTVQGGGGNRGGYAAV